MKSQLFEHIKTKRIYRVVEIGQDSETHEDLVVYTCAAGDGQVWIRSLDTFNEKFMPFDVNAKVEKPLSRIGFGKDEIYDF